MLYFVLWLSVFCVFPYSALNWPAVSVCGIFDQTPLLFYAFYMYLQIKRERERERGERVEIGMYTDLHRPPNPQKENEMGMLLQPKPKSHNPSLGRCTNSKVYTNYV